MPIEPLLRVPIARVEGRTIPRILWRIDRQPSAQIIERCLLHGADAFIIPCSMANDDISRLNGALRGRCMIVGINADELAMRTTRAIDSRLDALGAGGPVAILLQNVSLSQVKEGRTFHRVGQLRDRGRVNVCFVEADSLDDAEWMLRHTPAHGIAMQFGIADQSARYRVLLEAIELSTAILARRPDQPIWPAEAADLTRDRELSFIAAHPEITAAIEPLPQAIEDVDEIVRSVGAPMPPTEVARHWEDFRQHVAEPKKPRGAHPPDWA